MPKDLPSVEEAFLKLAAALKALEKPGLSKTEIMRLRTLIQTIGIYQKRFAEFVNYRRIEQKLVDADELFEEMAKRRDQKTVAPRIARRDHSHSWTAQQNGVRVT